MLRKLASITALVFAGSLALAGTALAAPYDPATVGAVRGAADSLDLAGTGYGDTEADDYVTATVLSSSGELLTYRFSLDDEGNFGGSIPVDECAATITIAGYPSGETRTTTVDGVDCGDDSGTPPTTVTTTVQVPTTVNGAPTTVPSTQTVVVGGGSGGSAGVGGTGYSSGGSSGSGGSSYDGSGYTADSYTGGNGAQGAYGSGYAATGAYGSGLANTGANIAAPIAIGAGTLLLGLGLLFFGTRGVVRRKGTGRV